MAALLAMPDDGSSLPITAHVKVFDPDVAFGDGSVRTIGDVIAPPPSAAATDYFFTIEGVDGETVDRSAPATGGGEIAYAGALCVNPLSALRFGGGVYVAVADLDGGTGEDLLIGGLGGDAASSGSDSEYRYVTIRRFPSSSLGDGSVGLVCEVITPPLATFDQQGRLVIGTDNGTWRSVNLGYFNATISSVRVTFSEAINHAGAPVGTGKFLAAEQDDSFVFNGPIGIDGNPLYSIETGGNVNHVSGGVMTILLDGSVRPVRAGVDGSATAADDIYVDGKVITAPDLDGALNAAEQSIKLYRTPIKTYIAPSDPS